MLYGMDYDVSRMFSKYFNIAEIARIYCSKAIYNQEQKVLYLRLLVINILLLLKINEMILSVLIVA